MELCCYTDMKTKMKSEIYSKNGTYLIEINSMKQSITYIIYYLIIKYFNEL